MVVVRPPATNGIVGDRSGAVALMVEGQLVARIEVGPLDAVWTAVFPRSSFAGIVSQTLENWKSVRVGSHRTNTERREKPVARGEFLVRGERSFPRASIQ